MNKNLKMVYTCAYSETMDIGNRLDLAMKRAGFETQNALALVSGVPQPTIARILKNSGTKGPEAGTLRKLAAACGVSFSWLNGEDHEPLTTHVAQDRAPYGPAKKPTKHIQAVIDAMEELDERGQTKIQFLVEDEALRLKKLMSEASALQPDAAALLLVELFRNGNEDQRKLIDSSLKAAIAISDDDIKKAS